MATIQSFNESLGVLKRNPLLFAAGLLYSVVVLPQSALSILGIPFVPTLLQMVTFFVTPFVVAGILAMAYEGRERPTSFPTFKKVGKDRYLRLLLGNVVQFAIAAVFGVVLLVVLVVTVGFGIAAAINGGSDPSSALLGSVGVAAVAGVAVVALLYLLLSFFLQFYAAAYVVDDADVIDGFVRSVGVVKENFVSALGFGVINLTIGLLLTLPAVALVLVPLLAGDAGTGSELGTATQSATALETSMLAQVGLVAYSFLVSVVLVPFRLTFSVSFYENHR